MLYGFAHISCGLAGRLAKTSLARVVSFSWLVLGWLSAGLMGTGHCVCRYPARWPRLVSWWHNIFLRERLWKHAGILEGHAQNWQTIIVMAFCWPKKVSPVQIQEVGKDYKVPLQGGVNTGMPEKVAELLHSISHI